MIQTKILVIELDCFKNAVANHNYNDQGNIKQDIRNNWILYSLF